MKTKYANTELKCGSTIPGDNELQLREKVLVEEAISTWFRNYILDTYGAVATPRLFGTLTNVSID